MGEAFRLLEGLDLDRLSAQQAIGETRRISDGTLKDMSADYCLERLEAISQLARIAAERTGTKQRRIPASVSGQQQSWD